jgi:hypothetical protein
MITDGENTDLQHYRRTAMLLASQDDCAVLAHAFEPDELANYHGWDDNGGDPDGPSWLVWPCDDTLIAHANRLRIPFKAVDGFQLPYPSKLSESYADKAWDLPGHWTGISCEECIFVVNENDAVEIMRSAPGIQS